MGSTQYKMSSWCMEGTLADRAIEHRSIETEEYRVYLHLAWRMLRLQTFVMKESTGFGLKAKPVYIYPNVDSSNNCSKQSHLEATLTQENTPSRGEYKPGRNKWSHNRTSTNGELWGSICNPDIGIDKAINQEIIIPTRAVRESLALDSHNRYSHLLQLPKISLVDAFHRADLSATSTDPQRKTERAIPSCSQLFLSLIGSLIG